MNDYRKIVSDFQLKDKVLDWKTSQLVYVLYGLTEEEVEIIQKV